MDVDTMLVTLMPESLMRSDKQNCKISSALNGQAFVQEQGFGHMQKMIRYTEFIKVPGSLRVRDDVPNKLFDTQCSAY